jgi:ABC-type multidrug transport system permease subunit
MRLKRFTAALSARNREFLRDRTAISWNIILPVMIVIGFAFFFKLNSNDMFKVGVFGDADTPPPGLQYFLDTEQIQFIPVDEPQQAVIKVERHQLDMLLDLTQNRYWVNQDSQNGYLLQRLLESSSDRLQKQTVSGKEIRYVDWVAPGVFGMNIMFGSLFGVGYVIVRYRKNGVLKRLKATPLTAFEFLSAQVVSRLWLIVAITILIYAGTNLFIGFRMLGSYLTLLLVLFAGALSMVSLSLIVAARLSSEEAANGLLNLLSLPMLFLSGVWFSLEGSSILAQKLASVLPLTHLVEAARAVMIDGAGLFDIAGNLIALAVMTVIYLLIAAYSFRWE